MLKFNKDNDFKFTLQPKIGNDLIDLSIMNDVKLVIKNEYMKSGFVPIWAITQNGVEVEVQKEMAPNIGIYFGVLSYRRPDGTYVDYFQDKAQGAALFEIVPLTEQAINDEDPVELPTSPNYKGDPFTYPDFTDEQILDLKKPAIDAGASISELEGEIQVNEILRVQAESERDLSEATRIQAENERLAAETIRQSSEGDRIENEATRIQNEAGRISEEGIRQSNEGNRIEDEATRVQSESERISKENVRQNSEVDRIEAEVLRVQAESERVQAEVERQITIQEAVTATNLANEKANLANIATQNANTAIINVNNARDNIMPSVLNNEEVQAETYNDLNERIIALENLVKEAIYSKITTDTIDVMSEIKMKGAPLIYVKDGAPSFAPDQVPQFYIDITGRKLYTARGTSSASDWF